VRRDAPERFGDGRRNGADDRDGERSDQQDRKTSADTAAASVAADARIDVARAITTSGRCPDYTSPAHAGR
jgi:hypothetical protein